MKHLDFLKSLKTIKSQMIQSKPAKRYASLTSKEPVLKSYCICTDSTGGTKYLYSTQQELQYLLSSSYSTLNTYPCPYEKGWHLTKG